MQPIPCLNLCKALIVLSTLLTLNTQARATTLEQARISLKNYGFVQCLDAAYRENPLLADDLAAASRTYHYMGKGTHFIVQNEDTLEITHDPYQATADFIANAAAKTSAYTKEQSHNNPLIACLRIYNSAEYTDFITRQDAYISNPEK